MEFFIFSFIQGSTKGCKCFFLGAVARSVPDRDRRDVGSINKNLEIGIIYPKCTIVRRFPILEVSDLEGLVACSGCFMILFYYLEPYAKVIT